MCKKNEHITYELRQHVAIIRNADKLADIEPMSAEQIYMELRMHEDQPKRCYYTADQADIDWWISRNGAELLPWVMCTHDCRGYHLTACAYTLDLYDDGEYQYTIDIKAESWGSDNG